jgi:TatD DNase family protein
LELIDSYLSIGSYFTLGVEVLTSTTIQQIAEIIPADRILLETDNPAGYEWLTNQVGMPVLLLEVLAKVSQLKEMDPISFENLVSQNWKNLTGDIPQIRSPNEKGHP